jgi:hypothetical protein
MISHPGQLVGRANVGVAETSRPVHAEPVPVSALQQIALDANQNLITLSDAVQRLDGLLDRLSPTPTGGSVGAVAPAPQGSLGEMRWTQEQTRERLTDLCARIEQLAVLVG